MATRPSPNPPFRLRTGIKEPDRDKPSSERRAFPTFLLPAEPPTWGATRAKTYRERIFDWNANIVGDLNAFPYVVFVCTSAVCVVCVVCVWCMVCAVRVVGGWV